MYLKKLLAIRLLSVLAARLISKRYIRERVPVVLGPPILHIFEYWIIILHPVSSQKAQVGDHASDRTGREGTPGEANEHDLISVDIVCTYVRIGASYVLRHSSSECAAIEDVGKATACTYAGLIFDDLDPSI